MFKHFNFSDFLSHAIRCIQILGESYDFFIKHKLWKGLFRHKWITLLTILLSLLFTYVLFSELYSYIFPSDIFSKVDLNAGNFIDSESSNRSKETAIFGGSKFFLLILLEIVIFHFSVRTLEILNHEEYKTTFGLFVKAEIRMVKVLVRSMIYSLIAQAILFAVCHILGLGGLIPILMFIVTSYFVGNAFFDNYNEQQKLNIKESDICIRHHAGAATALGIVASTTLLIPLIGVLITPIFGAITANIYGFRYHIENPPEH